MPIRSACIAATLIAMASKRREIRRLAMQVLYQIDATGECDREALAETIDETHDPPDVCREGLALALSAWADREQADALVAELTPAWPTHRQPPVDRAILRLACHEMRCGRTPAKVAINEAVELAKRYADHASPAFINGVLDKLARRLDRVTG